MAAAALAEREPTERQLDALRRGARQRRKLTPGQRAEVRRRLEAEERQVDLAAEFGVRQGLVSKIKKRERCGSVLTIS